MVIYQFNFRNTRIPDTGIEVYQQPTAENSSPSAKDAGISGEKVVSEYKPPVAVAEGDTAKEEISSIDTPSVYGKITDEDGNHLEGVDIVAIIVVPRSIYNQPQKRVETKSDQDGMYLLKDMRLNTNYVLLTHLEGYVDAESEIFTLTESRKKIEKNFTLKQGIVISGYVRDENGTAISGVDVSAHKASFYEVEKIIKQMKERLYKILSPHTKTDENGLFKLAGLGAGDWEIIADAEGYVSPSQKIINISFKEQLPNVEIVLTKATCFVSGKVTDREGIPIKGADVEARQMFYNNKWITKHTQTDGVGLYRIEGFVDAPLIMLMQVSANEFIPQERQDISPNSIDVDFILSPLSKIRGRVLNSERGVPVTRFGISVGHKDGWHGEPMQEIESPNGEFSIDVRPGAGWIAVVSAEGYETGISEPITVEEGETHEGVIIYLKQGRVLRGKVADEISGDAVSDALVYLGDKILNSNIVVVSQEVEQVSKRTFTNDEGMFILNGIPREATSVVVSHPDYLSQIVHVPAGNNHVQIMLSQGATLEGKVLRNGKPVTQGYIDMSGKWYYLEDDGSYRISGLSGGTRSVGVGETIVDTEDGLRSIRYRMIDVEIGEQGVTRHDFILQDGKGVVEGTVYVKPDIPAVGADIRLSGERIDDVTKANTRGMYRFEGLLPGKYLISLWPYISPEDKVFSGKNKPITLTENETMTVDFRLDH